MTWLIKSSSRKTAAILILAYSAAVGCNIGHCLFTVGVYDMTKERWVDFFEKMGNKGIFTKISSIKTSITSLICKWEITMVNEAWLSLPKLK